MYWGCLCPASFLLSALEPSPLHRREMLFALWLSYLEISSLWLTWDLSQENQQGGKKSWLFSTPFLRQDVNDEYSTPCFPAKAWIRPGVDQYETLEILGGACICFLTRGKCFICSDPAMKGTFLMHCQLYRCRISGLGFFFHKNKKQTLLKI